MPRLDFDRLAPELEAIDLVKGTTLAESGAPSPYVYFPESGILSAVAVSGQGQPIEAGLLGREGAGPVSALLGSRQSPLRFQAQIPARAHRIPVATLEAAMSESAPLRELMLNFAQTMYVQTSYTALSNAVHPIDERLARWILMCHDRHDGNELAMTHEFISVMLAVRRPSVTTSLHVLEGHGFIRSERGTVIIRNRKALEDFAGNAYGRPEAEYRRLIGPLSTH